MTAKRWLVATCLLSGLPLASASAKEGGFAPLFNGKDLTGWVVVNGGPKTWSARDGMIVTTGLPLGFLRSAKQHENFVLELEWKHLKKRGNSGVFVWADALPAPGSPFPRAIEVQVLDGLNTRDYTSHGDLFSIQGATCVPDRPHPSGWARCLPSERRCKPAGQWNHYRVECKDGAIKLAVNGKVVSGLSKCRPRKGYLCLEAEGSECHFRNLRIKELPGTKPGPGEVAEPDRGFVALFNGVDLKGWKDDPGHRGHWVADPGRNVLSYDGKSEAKVKDLWTAKSYGDFELVCDWRFPGKPVKRKRPLILPSGDLAKDESGKVKEVEVDDAGDSGVYLRGSDKAQVNIWCWPVGSGEFYGYREDRKMPAEVRRGVTPKVKADRPPGQWNRFVITMRGDRVTVRLNGRLVIDNARLPGVPRKGPLGLQHHNDPIEFANLFIRELK